MLRREVRRGNCLALITHRVGRTDGKVLEEVYTMSESGDPKYRSSDKRSEVNCLVMQSAMRLEGSVNNGYICKGPNRSGGKKGAVEN